MSTTPDPQERPEPVKPDHEPSATADPAPFEPPSTVEPPQAFDAPPTAEPGAYEPPATADPAPFEPIVPLDIPVAHIPGAEPPPAPDVPAAGPFVPPAPDPTAAPYPDATYPPPAPPYGTPYSQPVYGPPAPFGIPPAGSAQSQDNALAIGALVCSIVGFCSCVSALPGLIMGHIALAKANRGEAGGRNLALAAVVIGYVIVALYLGFFTTIIILGVNGKLDD
ncbi:DUF4190 domain-containing protein [Amycolatopsis samaneae]|uniref:DUF4190 domain-containing protein n=1 Tax=Amycolatopsis samaneae TaxID=664691 RepID=A0ABW5GKM8_9PSEU